MGERAFVLNNAKNWARGLWHGDGLSFGHILLWLAVWNTFVAAINVTLWPRVYDLRALVYMKPFNMVFPVVTCLILATCCRGVGLRSTVKALTMVGVIVLITFAFWNLRSEAWLNQYGFHILK